MIGKNNQNLKNKKEGVKIESYSIKKFKVGAASVVIGASIFFGAAGVANAAEVSVDKAEKNTDVEKVNSSTDGNTGVDKVNSSTDGNTAVLNNKISTEKEVAKPAKKEEVSADTTPTVNNNANADKKVEKKELDKNTLKTNIEKVEELLGKINKEKAPASTLAAVKIDLENAKNILNSTDAELTQAEIDALVKKLSEKISVLSSMPKANTPEKVVKEGKNTIANSGSRDSRNGQSMGEGTQFRAGTQIDSGALKDIKYYASVDPSTNGGKGTRNDDPDFTENKTVIKAFYQEDSAGKWIVYDVFFNNDGRKMTDKSYGQHYYFQPPFNIMDPANIVKDLSFTRYRKNGGTRLSDGFQGFEQYGNSAEITNPWTQKQRIFNGDRRTFYDPNSGVARENQKPQVFKNNANDPILNEIVRKKDGNYTGGVTYNLGIEARQESTDYAVHMHAKVKLKNDVTENEANEYGRVFAASVTSGPTTNQSYVVGARGTSLKPKDTIPPIITANGATVTKNEKIVDIPVTAEDNKGGVGMRPNNPIEVTGLPKGLTFTNGKITGTPTGPVGDSTVTIKAYDKNGNMATETITITVKDQASKYNPTGETLTVNQGQPITDDAVKAKVKNYGPGTLSVVSKPSTAKPGNVGDAVVKVTYPDGSSENVKVPVTVLEAPDNQPPTLTISPANQTVVEGEKVTFTLTATDNKVVNIDGKDFTTKYGTRLLSGKATNTNVKITDTEKVTTITITTTAEDVGKTNTITFNASDNAGNKAKPVTFTFNVTPRDTIAPTITAESATVTKNEPITQIPVTAVDNTGGVGMRDKNPIEVSNLPQGLKYANNQITGTPTGAPGNSTVTIKAYDKNGNMATKTIMITVKDQASKYNPTGESLTVNQGQPITDDAVKAKVKNYGPGTLTVQSKPNSTATAGNAGNAVVKVTYPDGSSDTVNVPVTVKDVTGPTIKADSATVTKNEPITPIPVTAVDNTGGVGLRDKNPIEVSNLPQGLKYENGQITGTTNAKTGYYTVRITAYDKNNTPSTKPIRITVQEQASKYNPTGSTLTVPYNHVITDDEVKAKVKNYGPGILTVQSKPSTGTVGNAGNAVVKVTYPDGSSDTVNVPVFVNRPNSDDYTPKYEEGSGKPGTNVEIPLKEENGKEIPTGTTYESDQPGVITVDDKGKVTVTIPADKKPGDKVTGKVTVTYPDGSKEDVPVTVTVVEQDKDIYTPKYEEGSGKPGAKVEIPLTEENGKEIPTGTTYESDQPGVITVDDKGKVTVTIPGDKKPGDKVTGKIKVTYPDGSKEEIPVTVTVTDKDKDIYTPKYEEGSGKPGAKVEIPLKEENGKEIPTGTTYESDQPGVITVDDKGKVTVTIPADKKPGDKVTGKVTVTYLDGSKEEIPVSVTVVNQDKDDYTPKYEEGSGKPGAKVEIPLTEENGKEIPTGTTYESDQPGVITVDKDGKVTVTIPEGAKPGDKVTGKVTVTYPDGSKEEIPVTVTVTDKDKDIYTPKYEEGSGKPGAKVEIPLKEENGKEIPTGTIYESDQPGVITVDDKGKVTVTIPEGAKPGDKITGEITVTYPDGSKDIVPVEVTVTNQDKDIYTPEYDKENGKPGTKVELPLKEKEGKKIPEGTKFESNTPGITVDKDGKVTVTIPEGAKPGDKITGEIAVTYPDGSKDIVPVEVTVTNQDKDIYTPEYDKENGKPGTKVELPLKEKEGKKIPEGTKFESNTPGITVDKDGKVTVTIPEGVKPGDKITGEITVTYPDGSKDIVPVEVTVTNQDKDIYTPEYDKENGKPGTKVELPLKEKEGKKIPEGTKFESNTPGITVDKDGKVTVTIPEGAKPGDKITGEITVTYPDGSKDIVPVEVTVTNQDKDIYTPEYDKENGKPGTKVELPLKEKEGKKIPEGTKFESNTPGITVDKDGKVTVTIPEGVKPGDKITGEITVTYPDGSKDIVPVEVTVTNQDKDIYTPEYDKENGKPGTKVELPLKEKEGKTIPGGTKFESNTPGITVDKDGKVTVTIPEGAKPGDKITGEITVTYPDGSKDIVPVEVTVTNQDKDIYTPEYDKENGKPGTKVELPLKEKEGKTIPGGTKFESNTPGITVDKDGKVTVTIPEGAKPGDKITGEITVTYPDGSKDIVPVEVTVTNQDKDIYTPEYDKENGKPGTKVELPLKEKEGKKIPEGTKFESNTPGITVDKDGKVTVTIPEGVKPGDKITGEITVTYPDGSKDIVPVEVTVTNQDKDIYTPEYDKENGKPGTKVELPLKEKEGKKIPEGTKFESNTPGITVDKDGKVTVTIPEGVKPGDKITGEITVTYPDGSKDIVPVEVTVTNQDKDIYTPEYDKENGKPGTKVELPLKEKEGKTIPGGTKFESNTPGITVDKDGKVTVTIPEGAKPGDKITGEITVTYPDGSKDIVPVEVTVTNQDKDIYTPEYDKGNGKPESIAEPKKQENSMAKVEKSTKRLANTGESETNTGLAGLGLAVLGSLLAIAKRRKEEESK